MSHTKVLSGALAPEALRAIITAGASGVDLTTVTSAVLSVRLPDLSITSWAVAISNATANGIVLTHLFVTGDTTQLGTYGIIAILTLPGGVVRGKVTPIDVIDPYS